MAEDGAPDDRERPHRFSARVRRPRGSSATADRPGARRPDVERQTPPGGFSGGTSDWWNKAERPGAGGGVLVRSQHAAGEITAAGVLVVAADGRH